MKESRYKFIAGPIAVAIHIAPLFLFSQETLHRVRGQVLDHASSKPVANATITLNAPERASTVVDSLGQFSVFVAPGRYQAIVTHADYRPLVRENIVVHSGKETVALIEVEAFSLSLESVVVTPETGSNEYPLDHWNVQNFAAVFYDPARVVNSNAGAVSIDDGTNHMTVRGASPSFVQWKVEEVEIVNPNHLENGGTVSDRPALNGGGVSMISAQLLERSSFRFAPLDAMHGNALTGVMDLRFRNGNNQKREHVVQASLIGIDLATEGPIGKAGGASYLINVRYSTIGLLSKLGVNFGDEKSEFADISHMLYLPTRRGHIKVFGINGFSQTLFDGKRDSAQIGIQKELQDIDYRSSTFINGLSVLNRVGNFGFVKIAAAYSSKHAHRDASPLFSGATSLAAEAEADVYRQEKLSTVSYLSLPVFKNARIRIGSYASNFTYRLQQQSPVRSHGAQLFTTLLQPFAATDIPLTGHLIARAGAHFFILPQRNYSALQPRLSVQWTHPVLQKFEMAYGAGAQLHDPYLYLSHASNRSLAPVNSQAFSLSHALSAFAITLRNTLFYQSFNGLASDSASRFSSFNYFNEQITLPLRQDGFAYVYGYDVRLERTAGKFYFIGSAAFYKARYSVNGSPEQPSRFDISHNLFLTGGRETRIGTKPHFWSIDARFVRRGGFNESGDSVPSYSTMFQRRLPRYWRVDLRLSYKINKRASTVIWALDLQNATHNSNVAYHYFDRVSGQTETRFGLGLIPVLSYKVMF